MDYSFVSYVCNGEYMTSLLLKTEEAIERTRSFASGKDVDFPRVMYPRVTILFYCDMCGNRLKKQDNGYYNCDCEIVI